MIVMCGLLLALPAHAAPPAQRVGGTQTPTPTNTPTITPTPTPALSLLAPAPGQALQGKVAIQGSTGAENFSYALLEFQYTRRGGETWFPLAEISTPVQAGLLAEWETSTISDGIYTLRLTVVWLDGSREQTSIAGLRVRNYTPIESDTPAPLAPTTTPVPGEPPPASPTPTSNVTLVPATGTALPLNPARLSETQVLVTTSRGALAILGLFALGGIYALVRGLGRQKQH